MVLCYRKQRSNIGRTNSIPYQVHHNELFEIVKNMATEYPLVGEVLDGNIHSQDDTFLNKCEVKEFLNDCAARRILQLHSFRIPYYVGHLSMNQKNVPESQKAWVVRATGEVTVWNFDKSKGGLVDMAASAENFIKRMTNKCTYLRKEDVLAKNSMLYSKFQLTK